MPIYHALLDAGTRSLLAISRYPSVVVFLAEAVPNSYQIYVVNQPSYMERFPFASMDPVQYPQWVWEDDSRTFVPAPADIQSEEIRSRSRMAVAKASVVKLIMVRIDYTRAIVSTGIRNQETIYLNKKAEAEKFLSGNSAEENAYEFPYVAQYADYAGISMKQASEEILFQAKLDDHLLAQTEILRIRYFNRVRKAQTVEELSVITEDFQRDFHLNGKI